MNEHKYTCTHIHMYRYTNTHIHINTCKHLHRYTHTQIHTDTSERTSERANEQANQRTNSHRRSFDGGAHAQNPKPPLNLCCVHKYQHTHLKRSAHMPWARSADKTHTKCAHNMCDRFGSRQHVGERDRPLQRANPKACLVLFKQRVLLVELCRSL